MTNRNEQKNKRNLLQKAAPQNFIQLKSPMLENIDLQNSWRPPPPSQARSDRKLKT